MSRMATDWAIPQQAKLKYTQLFNLHDRARSGFLSGLQCRDILLQSGLPRNILAEIWNLSDIDGDGQLTREEFILAMHLTNQVRIGQSPPSTLPADLVPPSYRRNRSISATSVNSVTSGGSSVNDPADLSSTLQLSQKSQVAGIDSAASSFTAGSVLNSNSFEDKRRENYEKGRAELERRRLKVIEQQSAILKEQLASCKEQVADAKAKIDSMRSERDTKMGLITSLEAQLQTIRDRKTYLDHEEQSLLAIAKDLNLVQNSANQAELDLLATQAKQENINRMKEKLKEFEKESCEKTDELESVKKRVDESKSELRALIERTTNSYDSYKSKLEEAKALRTQLMNENQSKAINLDSVWDSAQTFGSQPVNNNNISNNFANMTTNTKPESTSLKTNDDPWASKVFDDQPSSFTSPFGNNDDFGAPLKSDDQAASFDQQQTFGDAFSVTSSMIPATEPTQALSENQQLGKIKKFRAIYAFEARNHDELTVNPGDIITGSDVVCEPGWLSGECNGRNGLFPEAYVEIMPDDFAEVLAAEDPTKPQAAASPVATFGEPTLMTNSPRYKVLYAFEARNTDELTINPGDIITGIEGAYEPGWLMGELDGASGLFPEAYVEKIVDSSISQPAPDHSQSEAGGKLQRMSSAGSLRSKKSKAKRAEVATVIANYRALGQEQLNLEKGQLVLIRRKMDSGWWEGEVQVKDGEELSAGSRSRSQVELNHLIGELMVSESDYIADLALCQKAYIDHLSASSPEITAQVFPDWALIMRKHVDSLDGLFKARESSFRHVFEVFQNLINEVDNLYMTFCALLNENSRKLETKMASDLRFKQLVAECARKLKRESLTLQADNQEAENQHVISRIQRNANLPLASFMLKPMQRITKYSLLFERILKAIRTCGLQDLILGVEQLKLDSEHLCQKVNEACRLRDDQEDRRFKLRWAQSHIVQQVYGMPIENQGVDAVSLNLSRISSASDTSLRMSISPSICSSQAELSEYINFDSKTNCLGQRTLVMAGSFSKISSGKELIVFLFSDFLFLTQVKGGLSIREVDIFKSDKAKQAYYKPYRKPILLEDLVLLQSSNEIAIHQRLAEEHPWTQPIAPDCASALTFRDASNGSIYTLLAMSAKEKDSWFKELGRMSNEARDARVQAQLRRSLRPLRRLSVQECFGRLFITVVELKLSRSSYAPHTSASFEDDSTLTRRRPSSLHGAQSMNFCVQLQLKRMRRQNMMIDISSILDSDPLMTSARRETIPTSEVFQTEPIPSSYLGSSRYIDHCGYSVDLSDSDDRDIIKFNDDACTQFLLDNKHHESEFNINLLDISLVDESKFRESRLLAKRRVNLDQMLGLNEVDTHSVSSGMQNSHHSSLSRKQSLRLLPNRPVEYAFRLKLASNNKRQSMSATTSLIDTGGNNHSDSIHSNSPQCDIAHERHQQPDTSVKLRLHLQLFNQSHSPVTRAKAVPILVL